MNLKTLIIILGIAIIANSVTIYVGSEITIKEYTIKLLALNDKNALITVNGEKLEISDKPGILKTSPDTSLLIFLDKTFTQSAELTIIEQSNTDNTLQVIKLVESAFGIKKENLKVNKNSQGYSVIYSSKQKTSKFTRINYCLFKYSFNKTLTQSWCKT